MDFVTYYDNVLPKETCSYIIKKFEESQSQQEKTVLENHRSFTEINLNKNPDWSSVQDYIINIVKSCAFRYAEQFHINEVSWPEMIGYEQIRIKKYESNGVDEFRPHVDVQNYATARRFLVCFFYLNDVEEGGETVFFNNKTSEPEIVVKPVTGRVLIFPPLWTHPHAGLKPISGPKYIAGSYLHYV